MTISEATRASIVELSLRGYSQKRIADEVGVGKNTVYRVLQDHPKNGDASRTRATEASPKNGDDFGDASPISEPNPPGVPYIAPVLMTQDLAVNELMTLLTEAKRTLARVRALDPPAPSAEVAAVKAVRDILRLIGEWCGLDDAVKIVDASPVISAEDVEGMDLETMRRLVRDL